MTLAALSIESMTTKLRSVFEPRQATVLAETIHAAYNDLVKTSDFRELKEIVTRLAQTQERTESRIEGLTQAQERTEARIDGLTQAQVRSEARIDGLTQAQRETEAALTRLAHSQDRTEAGLQRLENVVENLAQELGGLSKGMGYALENEAYRSLPAFLQRRYGIKVIDRIVRTEIDGVEINFFARGEQNGQSLYLVGEAKLQLDERRSNRRAAERIFNQLDHQADVVAKQYPESNIVRLLVTHYARPAILQVAQARGVLVVQSFEW